MLCYSNRWCVTATGVQYSTIGLLKYMFLFLKPICNNDVLFYGIISFSSNCNVWCIIHYCGCYNLFLVISGILCHHVEDVCVCVCVCVSKFVKCNFITVIKYNWNLKYNDELLQVKSCKSWKEVHRILYQKNVTLSAVTD